MNTAANRTNELLDALASAKKQSEELKARGAQGLDVADAMTHLEEQVNALEKRAKETMKKLGCVSPETRAVYRAMADMLIAWEMFRDGMRG